MQIINQTNRTLLVDVINPDKMDLLTIILSLRVHSKLVWEVLVSYK